MVTSILYQAVGTYDVTILDVNDEDPGCVPDKTEIDMPEDTATGQVEL